MNKPIIRAHIRSDLKGARFCAAFALRKAARAVTNLYDVALQPTGVRSTQFAILVAVVRSQPVSIGSLSQLLLADRTTLTRSLGLMEKEGLLNISQRSTMRQRFVTLTEKGNDVLARSAPLWRKVQRRYVTAIGEEHWRRLQRELEKLSSVAMRMEQSRSRKGKISAGPSLGNNVLVDPCMR
jgi:DNA-binding MarR family transcriptional regulator